MARRHDDVLRALVGEQLVVPFFRNAILADDWPSSYQITIDSSPYYGHGDGYFHPSTHAEMGERQLYYMFHPKHRTRMLWEQHTLQDEMTLAMGSALHGVVQTQFVQAGLLRPENVEREYVIAEHNVRGRNDMVIDHPTEGELPVEFKTQNSRAFAFQREMKDIWKMQLGLALHGLGYEKGVLLVLESGYPYQMREYTYHRDDAMLTAIFAKFDYVMECIRDNAPPPHCCAKGSKEMKACVARYDCWLADEIHRSVK